MMKMYIPYIIETVIEYLVDVRDELALSRSVDLLVVGSHLTLDGEQKNLQVSLLCEPGDRRERRKQRRWRTGGEEEEVTIDDGVVNS